jgi:NAD(P)-dependent dehydrogenase (short-subunit alcohol dehydrogenase family)
MIVIVGGGDIAERGIVPVLGGTIRRCDVSSFQDVNTVMEECRPDVVINSAAVSRPATVADGDPLEWARELDVNLLGSFHVAKAAVLHDVKTMIFIASIAGLYGTADHSGYCASKAGVISLVRSLAVEGHDAYAISPGRVDSRMREREFPGEDPRTRLMPSEIGDVVVDMLAGDYEPGDNVIVRKIGFDSIRVVDKGEPWRSDLRIGGRPAR